MPQLGADMSEGRLIGWRKKVGDRVQRGDIIADVETDKADVEVEVFTSGVIEKFLVGPGEKVPVSTVLAIIREEGKPSAAGVPAITPLAQIPAPAALPAPPAPEIPTRPVTSATTGRIPISPAARKAAADLGVDPDSIEAGRTHHARRRATSSGSQSTSARAAGGC